MIVSKKKYKKLEKRIAELEKQQRVQQSVLEICKSAVIEMGLPENVFDKDEDI